MAKIRRQDCKDCGAHLDDATYKKNSASGYCTPCHKAWYKKWMAEYYPGGSIKWRTYSFNRNRTGAHLKVEALQAIIDGQNGKCKTCGDDIAAVKWEIDHIIPVSIGGTHESANLQILCKRCNRAKDNGSMQDFADWVGRIASRLLNDPARNA